MCLWQTTPLSIQLPLSQIPQHHSWHLPLSHSPYPMNHPALLILSSNYVSSPHFLAPPLLPALSKLQSSLTRSPALNFSVVPTSILAVPLPEWSFRNTDLTVLPLYWKHSDSFPYFFESKSHFYTVKITLLSAWFWQAHIVNVTITAFKIESRLLLWLKIKLLQKLRVLCMKVSFPSTGKYPGMVFLGRMANGYLTS